MTSGMFQSLKKPTWVAQDGRKFYKPEDFEDDHLLNMIPFLSRGIFNMSAASCTDHFEDDERELLKEFIGNRVVLAGSLLDEAKRRGLK